MFRAFDEDNNGAIDFREFIIGLSVSSRGTPDEKLGFAFKLYDVNRDGGLLECLDRYGKEEERKRSYQRVPSERVNPQATYHGMKCS